MSYSYDSREEAIRWLVSTSNESKQFHAFKASFDGVDAACAVAISQLTGFQMPEELHFGMSRIDEFAMSIMQSLISSRPVGDRDEITELVRLAVYAARTLEQKLSEEE